MNIAGIGSARLCERISAVQDPVIPIIAELTRANPGTISLGQGIVHYPPPPAVGECLRDFCEQSGNHPYCHVQGLPELLSALREKLQVENGISLDADSTLFVTAGGNLAFMTALLAISDPGDEILLMVPYYFNFEMAVTLAGCKPVSVPTTADYRLDLQRIKDAITERTRAVVTVSPNNPTGLVYTKDELREVNELCAAAGLYHINDEVYEYFVYDDAEHYSPASAPGAAAHTISLYSFSKAFGMASWRLGYFCAPKALEHALKKVQDTLLVCPPVVSQRAALAALQEGKAFCIEQIAAFAEVRSLVINELMQISDCCRHSQGKGAFYLLLALESNDSALAVARRLIEEFRVAVIPGSAFGAEGCTLRLSYGALPRDLVKEGMGRLVEGIKAVTA